MMGKKSDSSIKDEICEILYIDPNIDASEIEVEVQDGIVCLKGKVRNKAIKREAERCAEEVFGVEDVQNELRVAV